MNDAFLNRFQRILRRNFRVRAGQLVVNTLLLVLTGIVLIAIVDYCWELDRTSRAIAVAIWILGTILLATILGRQTGLRWSPPTTAAEIEAIFPQLGQSVRTTVQFSAMQADQVQQEGVTTSLVAALAERTHYQALPLTLEDIIPDGPAALVNRRRRHWVSLPGGSKRSGLAISDGAAAHGSDGSLVSATRCSPG